MHHSQIKHLIQQCRVLWGDNITNFKHFSFHQSQRNQTPFDICVKECYPGFLSTHVFHRPQTCNQTILRSTRTASESTPTLSLPPCSASCPRILNSSSPSRYPTFSFLHAHMWHIWPRLFITITQSWSSNNQWIPLSNLLTPYCTVVEIWALLTCPGTLPNS